MSKPKCPTKVRRVTIHKWGPWKRGMRGTDATPFRCRKCLTCGKFVIVYGNRGY